MKQIDNDLERALIRLADVLACLEESHGPEMKNSHNDDSLEPGPDPQGCSYCAAIERAHGLFESFGIKMRFYEDVG